MAKEETKATTGKAVVPMTQAQYFEASEGRKVVTPENIGGLLEYPALFHAMQDDRELRPALSESMTVSRVFTDFLNMSGAEFMAAYVVADGPVNPKTGKPYGMDTKAYAEWRAGLDKEPVSAAQMSMFGKMAAAFLSHGYVKALELGGYGENRNVVVAAKVAGVDCMCKVDRLFEHPDKGVVAVDVKSTGDLCVFQRSADSMHYREQQALTSMILSAAGFGPALQTCIAAVERGPMPRCGVFGVGEMNKAMERVLTALQGYAESCGTGVYGTGFEAPVVL